MKIAYRLQICDEGPGPTMTVSLPGTTSGSVDITYGMESASLFPPGGTSVHNDPFQISSVQGVAGHQPYLGDISGQAGEYSVSDQKWNPGRYNIDVYDVRVTPGGSNVYRWFSAFLSSTVDDQADTRPFSRLISKKCVIWENRDEATFDDPLAYSVFFVGRVTGVSLSALMVYSVEVTDSYDEFKGTDLFTVFPQDDIIHPAKLGRAYVHETVNQGATGYIFSAYPTGHFNLEATNPVTTRVPADTRTRGDVAYDSSWPNYNATNDAATNKGNHHLRRILPPTNAPGFAKREVRNVLTHLRPDDPRSSIATSDAVNRIIAEVYSSDNVSFIDYYSVLQWALYQGSENSIEIAFVDDLYQNYQYTPNPLTNGTTVFAWFYNIPGPLWINPQTPANHLWDICNGAYTSTIRRYPGSETDFTFIRKQIPLVIDSVWTDLHSEYYFVYRYDDKKDLMDTIESLLAPLAYGYCFEPVTASISGQIVAYNQLRLFKITDDVTTSGLTTISDSDAVADDVPSVDFSVKALTGVLSHKYLEVDVSDASEQRRSVLLLNEQTDDFGIAVQRGNVYDAPNIGEMDFTGIHIILNPNIPEPASNFIAYADRYLANKMLQRLNRLGWNPALMVAKLHRSTAIDALKTGDYCILNLTTLPNEFKNQRGGARIAQILSKSNMGVTTSIKLIDVSNTTQCIAPTFSELAVANQIVTVGVTGSATYPSYVQLQTAAISSSDTPVSTPDDSRWGSYKQVLHFDGGASQLVNLGGFPSNHNVYVQARTIYYTLHDKSIPSDWATPSPAYINVPAVTAPTNVTSSLALINENAATVLWTNTNTVLRSELLYKVSTDVDYTSSLSGIMAGSTSAVLTGLTGSIEYDAGVRYVDLFGGYSAITSFTFTATGSAQTLGAPYAVLLYGTPYTGSSTPGTATLSGLFANVTNDNLDCSQTYDVTFNWTANNTNDADYSVTVLWQIDAGSFMTLTTGLLPSAGAFVHSRVAYHHDNAAASHTFTYRAQLIYSGTPVDDKNTSVTDTTEFCNPI